MTRTYIPATLRQQVYERAEGRCEYCLVPETVTLTAHQVDHIILSNSASAERLSPALGLWPGGCIPGRVGRDGCGALGSKAVSATQVVSIGE